MSVRDDGRLVVVDSGLPCDTFNVVCRARMSAEEAAAEVAAVVGHFERVGRPFSWWVGPIDRPADLGETLVAAGLEPAESELAMTADLAELPAPEPLPPGLSVERVRTAGQLRAYAEINAANWDPPDQDVVRVIEAGAPALLGDDAPLWLYLGVLDGRPVAAAELTVAGGVVGLYNISTLAPFRRRGIGRALTLRPLLDARAEGHAQAVLQASPEGVPVYSKVGFRPTGRYTEYKPS
jgi:hypothetical protein